MAEILIKLDESRAAALSAAVNAGGAESVQSAVERAIDAWLTDEALAVLSDDVLQRHWREGQVGAFDTE